MGVIQEFFNNREIAIGIWVIIGLAVILPTKPARQFIKTAIPILFCKKFVIFYIVFLSFLGLVLFALNWAGLWDLTLLKDTVFWVLFVEFPLFAKAIEKADGGRFFSKLIRENVAIVVAIEFFVGFWTFSLITEIILIPLTVLISVLQVLAGQDKKHRSAKRFFDGLLVLWGIILLFISTHSSFVANKLGLQCLHLVANARTTPFKSLSSDTYNYFLKLPGYNTLRILLANKAILVEGPADELILQRAYIDNYGKQPIEDGIDVVAVDSLAFQRYCELASLISKPLTVVTDNDGNAEAVRKRYEKYTGLVTLCVESDNTLNTLEPSVLAANLDTFESFKSIIYLGKDIESRDPDSIKSFMIGNKTDWSMRVFTSEKKINYPSYILKAIGIDSENVGDRDE